MRRAGGSTATATPAPLTAETKTATATVDPLGMPHVLSGHPEVRFLGDALALDADWWTPVRAWIATRRPRQQWGANPLPDHADEVTRSIGDITGTGVADIVLASRRPGTAGPFNDRFAEFAWCEAQGRTPHLGVYTR